MTPQGQEEGRRYPVEGLRAFTFAVFCKAGLWESQAQTVTDSLIEANLRGVDTHGITRMLGIYVERIQRGIINTEPNLRVVREGPSTLLLDGDNGMGAVVAEWAMELTIHKARKAGSAWAAVQHSNHFGAVATWTMMAATEGMVGIGMTNGPSNMAPWGGVTPYMSTNPISFALPTSGDPVVLDMATSVAAKGNIILAAAKGEPIPPGWAMDKRGRPTTDAQEAVEGLVMPLGGHKGYALSMVIDALSGILADTAFGPHIGRLYDEWEKPQDIGHLFGAIDIGHFVPHATFTERIDRMIEEIHASELAEGSMRIYVPGEIEAEKTRARREEGIPLPEVIADQFRELGAELGVPFDVEPVS
jgi:LDH2 family malate/lactate/ureidoglycolate dehydrogenase